MFSCSQRHPGVKRQQKLRSRTCCRHESQDHAAAGHPPAKLLLWVWRKAAADRPRWTRVSAPNLPQQQQLPVLPVARAHSTAVIRCDPITAACVTEPLTDVT
jgi:hypothetical protein